MAQHRIKAALLGGAALALVAPGAAGAQECAPLLADLEPQLESAELGDEERSRIEQLLTSARLLQEVGREQGCVNIATEVAQMLGGSQGQQGLAAQQAGQPAAGMQQQRQAGTQAQAGGQQQPGTPSAGTGQQEAGAAGRIEQELEGSLRRARQQLEAAGAGASGAGMAQQIIIRQPAPEVLVRIPEPQVIIKMPEPEVVLQMPDPGVQVLRAEPQVSVEMAQPQVILERA